MDRLRGPEGYSASIAPHLAMIVDLDGDGDGLALHSVDTD